MRDKNLGRTKEISRRRRRRKVLVPVFYGAKDDPLIPFARALSGERPVQVLGIVSVPADASMSEAASKTQTLRTRLRQAVRTYGGHLRPKVLAAYNPEYEIASYVSEQNVDLAIMPWLKGAPRCHAVVEAILSHPPCNLAVLKGPPPKGQGDVLIVLRAGADSELALRLALKLSDQGEYKFTALRSKWMDEFELDGDPTVGLEQVLEHLPQVEDTLLPADDPTQTILEEAQRYDLAIIGASTSNDNDDNLSLDELTQCLITSAPGPVLVARAGPAESLKPSPGMVGMKAISILVDKWFAENTFHAQEFDKLERLLQRKKEQDLTISLALPSLNEEETVGNVIQTVKRALIEEVPLLDEMVLIDSNSTDDTRKIAESHDIPVYIHQEILPEYGPRQGKGEALWKSLYITQGDIILWIDTDIVNIHPRFVYGLIGPLLLRPELMYIKGFYLRPLKVGSSIQAGGGGRVTELTARPLINLFYPPLSGLVQPLSGEYGGRRRALEAVPFSSGYGVETGLLIDIFERFGLGAIGQVDLIRRVHHNQTLSALSMMSFAIIQTLIRKIDRRNGLQLLKDVNRAMKLIQREGKQLYLEVEEMAERERPPMINIPEYQALFTIDSEEAIH